MTSAHALLFRRHAISTHFGSSHKARCIHSCYKDARKRQIRLPLFPIVGTVRCQRSLRGPRRRPNGTGLSSAITTAPLVAVPSTRAPEHLAPEHCAVCAKSAMDCGCDCAPVGHRHSASHRGRTHGYVVSAASESQVAPTTRGCTGRPEVHSLMRLVDDGGPTATCCHAGRARRARR